MMDREDFAPAGIVRQRAEVDCVRLAAAHRAKTRRNADKAASALTPAWFPECLRCGVNLRNHACDHYAKMEAHPVEARQHGNVGVSRLMRKNAGEPML